MSLGRRMNALPFVTYRMAPRLIILSRQEARYIHASVTTITKKIKLHKSDEDIKERKERPLCVILGWGNSKHKNLRKYGEIFESKGFDTMTVTPKLADALVFPDTKGKKIAYQVLDGIAKYSDVDKQPVVLFQFSNGGCALFYFMCREIITKGSQYGEKIKVVGSIFDSCPVVPDMDSVILTQRVFTQDVKNPILKRIMWHSLGLIIPLIVWFNPVVKLFMDGLRDSPIMTPQLFLFSKSDMLAPYKSILEFIEYREKYGINVTAKLWDDTPHVSHMKQDPDGYTKMLTDFINKLSL